MPNASDEPNDPGFIGSPKFEYQQGWKLGQQDAQRGLGKRFSLNHSHFGTGYSEGYDNFKKSTKGESGV